MCGAALAALVVAAPAAQAPADLPVDDLVTRVGERVVKWYARAQSVISLETVSIQPLRSDLSPVDFPRRLAYELRVAWDPGSAEPGLLPEATVLRDLISINGRPPRERDQPQCMDPKSVSPEPLAMLLPAKRGQFAFAVSGRTRVGGRPAVVIEYRGVAPGAPEITWTRECVSVSLPGRSRGRIWVDAETYDVLRYDEHLVGMFDFPVPREHQRRGASNRMTIERADSSIQFRRVAFTDPEETLMLPASVDTVQIVRGGGVQRTRITQRFTDYRRFLTEGRVVATP
jgi:hypothetical protein